MNVRRQHRTREVGVEETPMSPTIPPSPDTARFQVTAVFKFPSIVFTHEDFPSPECNTVSVEMSNCPTVSAPMGQNGYTVVNILPVIQSLYMEYVSDVVPQITCNYTILDANCISLVTGTTSIDMSLRLDLNSRIMSLLSLSVKFVYPLLHVTHVPLATPTLMRLVTGSAPQICETLCSTGFTTIDMLPALTSLPPSDAMKFTEALYQIVVDSSIVGVGQITIEAIKPPVIRTQRASTLVLSMDKNYVRYNLCVSAICMGEFSFEICFNNGFWVLDLEAALQAAGKTLHLPAMLTVSMYALTPCGPNLQHSTVLNMNLSQMTSLSADAIFEKVSEPEETVRVKAIRVRWQPFFSDDGGFDKTPKELFVSVKNTDGTELSVGTDGRLKSFCPNDWACIIDLTDQPVDDVKFVSSMIDYTVTVYGKIGCYTAPDNPGMFKLASTVVSGLVVPIFP